MLWHRYLSVYLQKLCIDNFEQNEHKEKETKI